MARNNFIRNYNINSTIEIFRIQSCFKCDSCNAIGSRNINNIFFKDYLQRRKELKINNSLKELISVYNFDIILPAYLPDDYLQDELEVGGKQDTLRVEMIYRHKETEKIIWLIESKKPIVSDSGKMETSEININSVPVNVKKPNRKKGKKDDGDNFVECSWEYDNLYFNFRSDGLSRIQIEKVISSMLNKPI